MKLSERIRNTRGLPWQRDITDDIADEVECIEGNLSLAESVRDEALRTAKRYKSKILQLETTNTELLEALKDLVTDYEEIGGEAFYDDSYKQAKQAIRNVEESER